MTPTGLVSYAAVAAAAGYVGTKALEQISMRLYEWEPEKVRKREDAVRPGEPFVLAADCLSRRVVGIDLDEHRRALAGTALHYLAGLSWVSVYVGLRRFGVAPAIAGLATGVSQTVLLDEIITPAIGASAPNPDYPLVTHLRGLLAHAGYGLAVAAVVEIGAWLLDRR